MKTLSTISENQIIVDHKPTPIIILVILIFVLLLCVLVPPLITYFALSYGDSLHVGILFSYAIFWGGGFYLLRIILWNNYGKEIITLNKNGLTYIADYKYFKDGERRIGHQELQTEIIYEDTMDNHVGRLKIFNETEEIETVLQSTLADLEKMEEIIKTRYNSQLQSKC